MQQEMFDNELACWLAVYACTKWLETEEGVERWLPKSSSEQSAATSQEEAADEEEEEVIRRSTVFCRSSITVLAV